MLSKDLNLSPRKLLKTITVVVLAFILPGCVVYPEDENPQEPPKPLDNPHLVFVIKDVDFNQIMDGSFDVNAAEQELMAQYERQGYCMLKGTKGLTKRPGSNLVDLNYSYYATPNQDLCPKKEVARANPFKPRLSEPEDKPKTEEQLKQEQLEKDKKQTQEVVDAVQQLSTMF